MERQSGHDGINRKGPFNRRGVEGSTGTLGMADPIDCSSREIRRPL